MPLLPTSNINTNAVDLGQGPSVAKAGQVWDAVANVGKKIENFSSELAAKRKQAEVSSYVNSSANDFERYVSEKETEFQSKYTGDPTGYASSMNEAINDWYEQRQDSAPNDDAKSIWEEKFSSYSQNVGMRADAWENQSRVKYQVGQMDESVRKDQQHLAQKPDPTKAAQFLANTSQMINDGVGLWFNETEAKERLNKYSNDTVSSLFEGMEANKQYAAGLRLLNGKDPNSKILIEGLDPKSIANYKDRFTRLAQAENEFNKTLFRKKVGDVSFQLQSGEKVDKDLLRNVQAQVALLDKEEQAYVMDDLNHDLKYNEMLQNVKSLGINDATAIANFSIPASDGFNIKSRVDKAEAYRKKAQEILKDRVEQAPAFYAKTDKSMEMKANMALDFRNPEGMKSWVDDIVSKQETDKAGADVKILTPTMSKVYGTQIKSNNADLANSVVESLRSSTFIGENSYFGNAVSDMIKNEDITPVQGVALYMDNANLRADLLNATKNEKTIEESFKSLSASDKTLKSVMKELPADKEVQQIMKAISAADPKGERLWITTSLNKAMELAYKDAIANRGMDVEQAKERALSVVKSNFSVAYSGRSAVLLPKQYENKRSAIEDYMDSSLSLDRLKTLDIAPPASYQTAELVGDDPKTRYLNDIAAKGQWISNNAQNGAFLAKRNSDGSFAAVRDSKGNLIEVNFGKMRDNGFILTDEIRKEQSYINSLKDEAKTSVRAAGEIGMAQTRIAKLIREQKRKF